MTCLYLNVIPFNGWMTFHLCMYQILFLCSSFDGHLDDFQLRLSWIMHGQTRPWCGHSCPNLCVKALSQVWTALTLFGGWSSTAIELGGATGACIFLPSARLQGAVLAPELLPSWLGLCQVSTWSVSLSSLLSQVCLPTKPLALPTQSWCQLSRAPSPRHTWNAGNSTWHIVYHCDYNVEAGTWVLVLDDWVELQCPLRGEQ